MQPGRWQEQAMEIRKDGSEIDIESSKTGHMQDSFYEQIALGLEQTGTSIIYGFILAQGTWGS